MPCYQVKSMFFRKNLTGFTPCKQLSYGALLRLQHTTHVTAYSYRKNVNLAKTPKLLYLAYFN